jgi:hypothetical protein
MNRQVLCIEFSEHEAIGRVGSLAACDGASVQLLEVLRQLVGNLGFSLGCEAQRREACADLRVPITHIRPPPRDPWL